MSGARESTDLYAAITEQIVAAIEKGAGTFEMPWHRSRGTSARPWNVVSGKRYQGINVVALWLSAEAQAFPHPVWGTYRQWQAKGAQVRRGERSSMIVFYKTLQHERENPDSGETEAHRVPMARASRVFNVAQVDGYALDAPEEVLPAVQIEPVEAADHLVRASAAEVREGGERAFYSPREDFISMPDRARFTGSATMDATEAYYATLLHELTHWSGGEKRLNRDLKSRFGTNAYAMEELVAELGASYLCADLSVTTAVRPDHAAYIQAWLTVLRADKRAVFMAAARAQDAARFLLQFAPPDIRDHPANRPSADDGEADPRPPHQRPFREGETPTRRSPRERRAPRQLS